MPPNFVEQFEDLSYSENDPIIENQELEELVQLLLLVVQLKREVQFIRRNILVNTVVIMFSFCVITWVIDTVGRDLQMLKHWLLYALLFCGYIHFTYKFVSSLCTNIEKLWMLKTSFKWFLFLALYFLLLYAFLVVYMAPESDINFIRMLLQMYTNFNVSSNYINATFTERDMRKYQIYMIH